MLPISEHREFVVRRAERLELADQLEAHVLGKGDLLRGSTEGGVAAALLAAAARTLSSAWLSLKQSGQGRFE